MSYLIAIPGFKQIIDKKPYRIIRMYSTQQDAEYYIKELSSLNNKQYKEIRLYLRKKAGKLFGRHPYCIAVR